MSGLRTLIALGLLLNSLPAISKALSPGNMLNPSPAINPPAHSAIMFSTRWERPEARAIAAEFGATHFTWLYPKTRDYLADLRRDGFSVGTTLNANQTVPDAGLARNLEGEALIAPWMQAWKARWISISSHAARTALLDAAERHVAWGAESIQFDDAALATASFGWGGDFSDAAVQGFGRWLAGPGAAAFPDLPAETHSGHFDYRTYLAARGITTTPAYLAQRSKLPLTAAWERFHLEEVRSFFDTLRTQLHARPQPIALNLNLTNPRPDARTFNLLDLADGVMSETSADDLANAALGAATVQGTGATYLPSLQPHDVAASRRQIAAFYALGALPLVPWDVYMPDLIGPDKQRSPQPRYFGTPAEYADLYRFVRSQPALFDKQESIASVLLLCQVEHFKAAEVLAIVRALQARQIPFALMVARSGYPARPLDAERIKRAPAVIFASSFSNLDPASQATLAEASAKRIQPAELDAHSARLAPIRLKEPTPVLILPRLDPARPQELIVHLIRTADTPGGPFTLQVNPDFTPFRKISHIEVFSPGQPKAQNIVAKGLAFSVSFDTEWAVLRLQLE